MNIIKPTKAIGREDLATNFMKHYDAELEAYGAENGLSLSETLQFYSPAQEKVDAPDALLGTIERLGLRTDPVGNLPASPLQDFFNRGSREKLLGFEFVSEAFHRNIGQGMVDYAPAQDGEAEFAVNTRSGLTYPFDPARHIAEVRRNYRPRVMLQHVVARRVPNDGSTYQPGIIESPDNTKLRPTAEGANLPEYTLKTAQATGYTQKVGYQLIVTKELVNNANMTMDLIAESQRQKAAQVESALVDEATNIMGTGATAFAFSATPTRKEIRKLLFTPRDIYYISVIIGTIDAVVEYADPDFYFASMNPSPGTRPMNEYLDDMGMRIVIGSKTTTEVPQLTETGKEVMIAWDAMAGIDYVVERRSMISESDNNVSNQTMVFTNSHRYLLYKKAEATQASYRVVFG